MSRDALGKYCSEVLRFSKALNLTSVKNDREFMDRFVEPSVALAKWMPETGRLLDIGSGMGVPGIPLLIASPGLQGVLVERRKKRAEFLRHLVRVLKLDAEVYDADINDLPCLGVDICVARAVTSASGLLDMCTPHVNDGAIAVFPVPRASLPEKDGGWVFRQEYTIQAGDSQKVHCYDYYRENLKQGDVSRET